MSLVQCALKFKIDKIIKKINEITIIANTKFSIRCSGK